MSISSALVTGGAGFVGSAIIDALLEKHPECAITSLDVKPADGDAERRPTVDYFTVDITDAKEVSRVVQEAKPSVIIHVAGIVATLTNRYTRKNRDLFWKINVEGTRNMLAAAKEAGVEAFVYTSSCCSVTDDLKYQYPNASAEALVLGACSQTLSTCAIRPSVIFGPDDYQLIPSVHACIAKHETPFIIGTGDNLWDVTYISNIADAHILAVENLMTTRTAAGEAFFVSNNEPIPFRDFCLEVWRQFGHYPPFEVHIPERLGRLVGYAAEWTTWLTGMPTTLSSGSVILQWCKGAEDPQAYAKRLAHNTGGHQNAMNDDSGMNSKLGTNGHVETTGHKVMSTNTTLNEHAKATDSIPYTALNGAAPKCGSKELATTNGCHNTNGTKNKSRNGTTTENAVIRGGKGVNGYVFINSI